MTKENIPLLKVNDIDRLNAQDIENIYIENINPGQVKYFKILGFNKRIIARASGVYYHDQKGEKILDLMGGFGSVGLGHNHPRILEVRKRFQEEERHEIGMGFYSQYAAALSKNLALICPGDLDYSLLCNSGSEAMEGALKIVEKYQGSAKNKFIYANNSFHGKTRGSLSITDSTFLRSSFQLLSGSAAVPFGDADAIEKVLNERSDIGAVVLEPIQGGAGIIVSPQGYLKRVRELCDRHNVLLVLDEIQCGFGRTGKLFAFEHDDVIPDVVAIAKSLGGSKTAMAAFITRKPVFMKAYGSPQDAFIHSSSTFGGLGEASVTAVEAINILYEEGLLENAETVGTYFLEQLNDLKNKYPKIIKDVRGKGLMIGIEYHDLSDTLIAPLRAMVSKFDERLRGSITGFMGSILLNRYNILVAFTEYNRNVMRLQPPLILQKEHVDHFIRCMNEILNSGISGIITRFIKLKI
jgi:ornithine--oxo-acid transaminase